MTIKNLNVAYEDKVIYKDFNMQFDKNKVTCIMGASGSGKTTLLRAISSNIPKNMTVAGEIENFGKIAYCFQNATLIPVITCGDNCEYVLRDNMPKLQAKQTVKEVFEWLAIEDCYNKYPNEVSGGQANRVAIARAIVYEADTMLLDESFKGLDLAVKFRIIDKLLSITKGKKNIIFVTHDIDEALYVADRIVLLEEIDGKVELRFDCEVDVVERDFASPELMQIRKNILKFIM